MEPPSLKVFKKCLDVALGDYSGAGLMVGIDDIKGLFQP